MFTMAALGKKQESIRQIIKEPLDFPGHLCDQRTFKKRFIFVYATESQVTDLIFLNQESARSGRTVRNLRAKKVGRRTFAFPGRKLIVKSDCVTRIVYICV